MRSAGASLECRRGDSRSGGDVRVECAACGTSNFAGRPAPQRRPHGFRRRAIGTNPEPPDFSSTLSARERRLAGRLEGFGDIVFGFAISQCALMLTNARGRIDISHPLALLLYFATFASLALLWLSFHRMLSTAFRPARIDLALVFAFLAFVSLMPFAMYAQTHDVATLESARRAVGEYSVLYALLTGIGFVIAIRNLRRGWYYFDEAERDRVWHALVRNSVLCGVMAVSTVVDVVFGPSASGLTDMSIAVVIRIARLRFPHPPSAAKLRVAAPS